MLLLLGVLFGQKKKMEFVFFSYGDLIDVFWLTWWGAKLFLILSLGCKTWQLWILLILGESYTFLLIQKKVTNSCFLQLTEKAGMQFIDTEI